MGFFNNKKEFIGEGILEVPEAKVFHIPSKLDLKYGEVELKVENIDQRVLLEIVGMLTGKAPLMSGKLEFNGEPNEAHIEINPADRQAKIDKISRIKNGEDIEVFDLAKLAKETKLPHISQKFRCPDCEQSLLLAVGTMIIVRDIVFGTNKAYSIPVDGHTFPGFMNDEGEISHDKVIEAYNDCIELVKDNKGEVVQLVSDSEDDAFCPICGKHHKIKDFVLKYESDINDNKCDICGDTKETTISNNGETLVCSNNDCYSKLIKKNS
jgi:rubredoxin